jgi:NADP-dependent 3-hydroxy acid dehydrogenase YdfG
MAKRAVVTGASSGIGAATVQALVSAGFDVVAGARRLDRLEQLKAAHPAIEIHALDVTDEASVDAFVSAIDSCHVLVNNAGAAYDFDQISHGDPEKWRASFDVNVIGALRMTQALLPVLARTPQGFDSSHVLFMGSTAGRVAYEGGGSYAAAKHGLAAMVGTLRLELAGQPIRVTEIAPGMVRTDEFTLKRFEGDSERADALYADVDRPLTAEDIADCVVWAVTRPAHVNIGLMVVRPIAQAAQHKTFRGPIGNREH